MTVMEALIDFVQFGAIVFLCTGFMIWRRERKR